ncbi:MAG: hypothetical protein CYG60_06505 [Actinobacteria bacterium]|nr:MAG: hypothetical protein CYG60_06505 [Actinomycetota bacterium]
MNAWTSLLRALAEGGEFQRINKSFGQEWYTVPEAVRELNKRGADVHPETLRRWIRAGKVKVSKPSPRKTLIPKSEMVRLLTRQG